VLLTERQRRRLRADSSAMLGLAVVVALLVFALIAPLVLGDPNLSDFTLARDARGAPPGPSLRHLLGTDRLFRDNLARLAHGARLSLFIALSAVFVAVAAGTLIGLVSGYFAGGRWKRIDDALMRIVDVALAFPYLLLVTAIGVAIDRADVVSVVLILGLTSWTGIARVVRQKAAQLAGREYVLAARALGATGPRIVWRHLLPGVLPTVLILATSSVAQMIIAEAVLGYLTVGIEPPQASWGRMLQEAESYLAVAPLVVAAPGLSILLAALAFTRLGDGLRDAIDPY
jgi:ABC-type dipeptide/oligopeptide/nickel transport system permease subunit